MPWCPQMQILLSSSHISAHTTALTGQLLNEFSVLISTYFGKKFTVLLFQNSPLAQKAVIPANKKFFGLCAPKLAESFLAEAIHSEKLCCMIERAVGFSYPPIPGGSNQYVLSVDGSQSQKIPHRAMSVINESTEDTPLGLGECNLGSTGVTQWGALPELPACLQMGLLLRGCFTQSQPLWSNSALLIG